MMMSEHPSVTTKSEDLADEHQADDTTVLVIAVTYESPEAAATLIRSFAADRGRAPVDLVLAVNSPTVDPAILDVAAEADIQVEHFPLNPAYTGAGRQVLSRLVAAAGRALEYDAVVLCNVDLKFSSAELVSVVAGARDHTGDYRWILAPDIVEPHRKYRVNPQSMRRPERYNGRFRHALRRRSARLDRAYRWAYRMRRNRRTNPNADSAPFTPMYSAGGAFTIFGKGYFSAGGVFHEGPLFSEEYGFAEQAHHLGIPVLYVPQMVVLHESEVTTSADRRGHDQRHQWHVRADSFYRAWRPEYVIGSMTDWFTDDGSDDDQAGVSSTSAEFDDGDETHAE